MVDEVRVLSGPNAAGPEPHLALDRVHPFHAADHPLSPGHLVLYLPCLQIIQVQVVPAVALRHPEHFPSVVQVVREALLDVGDKRSALLIDQGDRLTAVGVHADDAEDQMAALVVQEREPLAVAVPADVVDVPRVGEQLVADGHLLPFLNVEETRLRGRDRVAGFAVVEGVELRLELVPRRRLDQVNIAWLVVLSAQRRQPAGVRRPVELAGVAVVLLPVLGQGELSSFSLPRPQEQVVVLDKGGPPAVGGDFRVLRTAVPSRASAWPLAPYPSPPRGEGYG